MLNRLLTSILLLFIFLIVPVGLGSLLTLLPCFHLVDPQASLGSFIVAYWCLGLFVLIFGGAFVSLLYDWIKWIITGKQ